MAGTRRQLPSTTGRSGTAHTWLRASAVELLTMRRQMPRSTWNVAALASRDNDLWYLAAGPSGPGFRGRSERRAACTRRVPRRGARRRGLRPVRPATPSAGREAYGKTRPARTGAEFRPRGGSSGPGYGRRGGWCSRRNRPRSKSARARRRAGGTPAAIRRTRAPPTLGGARENTMKRLLLVALSAFLLGELLITGLGQAVVSLRPVVPPTLVAR